MNQDLIGPVYLPISSCPPIPLVLDFLGCALAFLAPLRSFPKLLRFSFTNRNLFRTLISLTKT
jgi:hypothetical protein